MERSRAIEIRVGIFVTVALVIAMTFAIAIGRKTDYFSGKVTYKAIFTRVSGLRQGSQVYLAGVDVGTVKQISFDDRAQVVLTLELQSQVAPLIREGTEVAVASKSMLGEKLLAITPASEGPQLPPGSTLVTREQMGLAEALDRVGTSIDHIEMAASGVRKVADTLSKPSFLEDVEQSADHIEKATSMVTDGAGPIKQLLENPEWSRSVGSAVQGADASLNEASRFLKHLTAISEELQSGNGTGHELIYGEAGKALVKNFGEASGEIAAMLRAAREGEGALHQVLYAEEGKKITANLTAISQNLREITHRINKGEGTLGRLLVDPSLYEDVKRLVGDLERNKVLKSLVRYSIRHNEKLPEPKVEDEQ